MHTDLNDYLSPIGTVLAAIVGVTGSWLAFIRYPREVESLRFRLRYVEEQLSHFYGPLLGLLQELDLAYAAFSR